MKKDDKTGKMTATVNPILDKEVEVGCGEEKGVTSVLQSCEFPQFRIEMR